MSDTGDLQLQVNILFFAVFLLVVFVIVALRLAFKATRQWQRIAEQQTNKIVLLEERVASMEGK